MQNQIGELNIELLIRKGILLLRREQFGDIIQLIVELWFEYLPVYI